MTLEALYEILRDFGLIDWPYRWPYLPQEQQEVVKRLHARLFQ